MGISTTNPATGEVVREFAGLDDSEVDKRLAAAADAAQAYRRTSYEQRAGWLRAAADMLEADTDRVGALMTLEMGKTLAAAKAEVSKCAKACRYYAEHAPSVPGRRAGRLRPR